MSFSEKANDVSVGVSDMLSESLANSPTTRLTHINTRKEIAKTNLSMELNQTTSELAKQNKILGNQIVAALTNSKLHGKELNNERSLAILPTSVSHINTRKEIAKLIYQKS
jgi:PPE-repeat protein